MAILTVYRREPGSGKTTFAKESSAILVDPDMFFQIDGKYHYDRLNSEVAFAWCEKLTNNILSHGMDVNVAGTFVTIAQLEPYANIAKRNGAVLKIVEARGVDNRTLNFRKSEIGAMASEWEECRVVNGFICRA